MAGSEIGKILRFGVVGGAATASYALMVWLLVDQLDWPAMQASMVGYMVSLPVSYAGQRRITFRSRGAHRVQIPKFMVLSLTSLLGTTGGMFLMHEMYQWHYLFGIGLAVVAVPVLNFLVMRSWIFRDAD